MYIISYIYTLYIYIYIHRYINVYVYHLLDGLPSTSHGILDPPAEPALGPLFTSQFLLVRHLRGICVEFQVHHGENLRGCAP